MTTLAPMAPLWLGIAFASTINFEYYRGTMQRAVSREILEEMMLGKELTAADLARLMEVPEDQYLEFKDGKEMASLRKAASTVREYVSAFANSDGGILIIGVSDGNGAPAARKITPTTKPGGKPLVEWARSVLHDQAAFFAPPPRFQVLTVGGAEVLVIAVLRSPLLVPCAESNRLVYWIRLGDSTLPAPQYLLSDLLLGRRAHPQLRLVPRPTPAVVNNGEIHFAFDLENEGTVTATDVVVGIVAWAQPVRSDARDKFAKPAVSSLRTFVDIGSHPSMASAEVMHASALTVSGEKRKITLAPFESAQILTLQDLLVTTTDSQIVMRSAAYTVAKGAPVQWYQMDWCLHTAQKQSVTMHSFTPMFYDRPVIGWNVVP